MVKALQKASDDDNLMSLLINDLSFAGNERREKLLRELADGISSGRLKLFTARGWKALESIQDNDFWRINLLFRDLIPHLDISWEPMTRLVVTLVDRGGNDLMASAPNGSFLEWCKNHLEKSTAIVDAAISGNAKAEQCVTFALTALNDREKTLELEGDKYSLETRLAAITALGRIELDPDSARKISMILAGFVNTEKNNLVRLNSLFSCFSIASRFEQQTVESRDISLNNALAHTNWEDLGAMSSFLSRYSKLLSNTQLDKTLGIFREISEADKHVLSNLDVTTHDLDAQQRLDYLVNLVGNLISNTKGTLSLSDMPSFKHTLITGNQERLGRIFVDWMLTRDHPSREALCNALSDNAGAQIRLTIHTPYMPSTPCDQLQLCRRVVGYLFMRPVTAASILISVLKHASTDIKKEIMELLYNPLLVSYGGKLKDYLDQELKQLTGEDKKMVAQALSRKERLIKDQKGIEILRELWPSEEQRQAEEAKWNSLMRESMKEAEKQSALLNLVSKQYLLYGKSSSTYMQNPSAEDKFVDMKMGRHSVIMEYPTLEVLDSTGLHIELHMLKFGELKECD